MIRYYRFVEGELGVSPVVFSRTGYTGEDGFEIFARPEDAPAIWRRLIEAGAVPAGLGARDTLRLEAGMCLYGNELDAETTPLEAGISFAVHLAKEKEFIGQEALRREKEEGLKKRLVGFKVEGRGIARHDYPITVDGVPVGVVTSGTLSPTLNEAIGLAFVAPDVEDRFEVVIRTWSVPAHTVPLPFYKRER
jgi:aminomethyltransferase